MALSVALVMPAMAAETDKDGKVHNPNQPRQNNVRPQQQPQQQQKVQPNFGGTIPQVRTQARPQVQPPPRQPIVQAPQRTAPSSVRAPIVRESDRARQFERRGDGDRRDVRRYDGGRWRDASRYGRHRNWALGAGIVVIGGIIGYEMYRGRDREDVFDRCDRNFPDFDYDTGSFVNEDGDREVCPYLID